MDNSILSSNTLESYYQDTLITENPYLVYKRNELIHASFDLSTFAQKAMIALIARIDPRRGDLPVFEFSVSELANILGVSKQRVFTCIDEVTTELQSQVVTLEIRDKVREEKIKDEIERARLEGRECLPFVKLKNTSFDKFNWFEVSSYRQDEGVIRFKFNNRMENYLLDFNSNFTKYSLPNVLKMNSKYSIRFYELFRSFLSTKAIENGQTSIFRTMMYEDLRVMLGIKANTINKFYDFERSVLKQAKKELDKSDLSFTYSFPERSQSSSRKKVTKILFNIYHQKSTLIGEDWKDSLKKWVRPDKYNQLILQFGEAKVKRNVNLIINQIEEGRDIKNIVAYILKAVKMDYAGTNTALDPFTYTDQSQREFVKQVLLPHWAHLDKRAQSDFITYRFSKGLVADNFTKFQNKSGQRSISAALMDIDDISW